MIDYYNSTRNKDIQASSKAAIIQGIAQDGGLFVLNNLDEIHLDIASMINDSYCEMAQKILVALLPDFSEQEILQCVKKAYNDSFDSNDITPLHSLPDFDVLELFHGPTCAFKDIGLQMLPQLMQTALHSSSAKKIMILTATSGDTGKAALEGFKDVDNISISTFFPHHKVSNMQYLQMATQTGSNTNVCAIKGNFDDAQSKVKSLFLDNSLKKQLQDENIFLSSANSINIGRLIPQVVYYFYAYAQLVKKDKIKINDQINFCIPTGNFGNTLAGYYAKVIGLPVNKLIVASNANNVLYDFFKKGVYNRNRAFVKTISPSMDILISSNLERLLYYICDKDCNRVKAYMDQLEHQGSYQLNKKELAKINEVFCADFADDLTCKKTIRTCFDQHQYVIDPHTATGYSVLAKYLISKDEHYSVLLATASPYKFAPQVLNALTNQSINDDWECIKNLAILSNSEAPYSIKTLQNKEIIHTDVISIEAMHDYVIKKCLKENCHD